MPSGSWILGLRISQGRCLGRTLRLRSSTRQWVPQHDVSWPCFHKTLCWFTLPSTYEMGRAPTLKVAAPMGRKIRVTRRGVCNMGSSEGYNGKIALIHRRTQRHTGLTTSFRPSRLLRMSAVVANVPTGPATNARVSGNTRISLRMLASDTVDGKRHCRVSMSDLLAGTVHSGHNS
jgi:hypothetical protein